MMQFMLVVLTVTVCICSTVSGARILLLGSSVKYSSHQLELLTLGDELVRRGHEVYSTVARRTTGESEEQRMTRPNITKLFYTVRNDYSSVEGLDKQLIENVFRAGGSSIFATGLFDVAKVMMNDCEELLTNHEFLLTLRNLQFDMVVVSRFPFMSCFYIVPYFLRCPFVSIGAGFEPWLGGSPTLPSFTYNVLLNYGDRMNFWQRMANFVVTTVREIANSFDIGQRNHRHLLATYAPEVSNFKEISDQSQLFFVTREHVVEWPVPTMPNVIFVPSLGCIPSNPLPEDLTKIVTSSKHGVILVSFGTMADYLPREVLLKMVTTFNQVKYDVLWKFPSKMQPSDFSLSANIHVKSWLPQNDLLGHNNIKLFVTHCGNNGQYESIYQGVPMVAFPLFGEQHHNAFRMEYRGFGVSLDIVKFTSEELLNAINDVIENTTFSKNVKKASAILKDAPMTPRATVAYWIEHVIKFGNHHLRSHAMDLAWYEYFMIDVLLFILAVVIIVLLVGIKLCSCCIRLVCCKKQARITGPKTKND